MAQNSRKTTLQNKIAFGGVSFCRRAEEAALCYNRIIQPRRRAKTFTQKGATR